MDRALLYSVMDPQKAKGGDHIVYVVRGVLSLVSILPILVPI
jgi:hypothetical protein